MVIFYSLGNIVTGQETFDTLLEGMAQFSIQKTVQNGETSIQILSPSITPMVMHYDYNSGEYRPYLLRNILMRSAPPTAEDIPSRRYFL